MAEKENSKGKAEGSRGLGFTSSTAYGTKSSKPAESRVNAEEDSEEEQK